MDRLILAVERREFEHGAMAGWTKVIFENAKGKVWDDGNPRDFEIFEFERKILEQNQYYLKKYNFYVSNFFQIHNLQNYQ